MASNGGPDVPNGPRGSGRVDTPLPTDSVPFEFTCQCLNLRVEGRAAAHSIPDKAEGSSTRYQVWLGDYAESGTFPVYIAWEQDDLGPDAPGEDSDSLRPSWRKCSICETKCYFYPGKDRWATIDLSSGIRWGPDLEQIDDTTLLPFSQLLLPLPSGSSTFGRPPSTNTPNLYPHSPDESHQYLIPPVQDPFFLPPPFIPSHPQLRSLCENAVGHLRRRHEELETRVREYIAATSREMRETEEKVRAEVELLWERYKSGPGKGEDLEPRKPDPPRPALGERKRSRTINSTSPNPIMLEAARSPAYPTGSLLAQSLSANPYASPPAPVADAVDDDLAIASKTHGKGSDARAVAMSHVFSVLDEAMASRGSAQVSMSLDDAYVETEYDEATNEEIKDSWIDDESAQCDEETLDAPMTQGSTPKTKPRKGKEKAVKFEEPAATSADLDDEAIDNADADNDGGDNDEYVFDFEVDEADAPPDPDDIVSATPPQLPRQFSRTRNMVEANLSLTFAADAPSHRSAWKRHLERGTSMLESIRRQTDNDSEDSYESSISQLATSMPVAIALNPKRRGDNLPPMEPKTSLTDRQGKLVPPLRAAMREPGVGNALGLSPSRPSRGARRTSKTTRSASASREREQVASFKQDPGAVFESLADDAVGSDEEEDQEGTLRESKTFMPPHEVIKREEGRQPDVGWRSMAQS